MKALLVEPDLAKDPVIVEGDSLRELCKAHGIEWFDIVRTQFMHDNLGGSCMLVDDDGHQKHLPQNLRANIISGYPDAIVGNALFLGYRMGSEGGDVITIRDDVSRLLLSKNQELLDAIANL